MRLTILLRFQIFQSIFGTRHTFIALICNEIQDTWRLCAIRVQPTHFPRHIVEILTENTNLPKDGQLETKLDFFFLYFGGESQSNCVRSVYLLAIINPSIPRSWHMVPSRFSSRRVKRDVWRGSSENFRAWAAPYVGWRLRNYNSLVLARQESWRARRKSGGSPVKIRVLSWRRTVLLTRRTSDTRIPAAQPLPRTLPAPPAWPANRSAASTSPRDQ